MTILNKVASELTTTVLKTKTWLVELDEDRTDVVGFDRLPLRGGD